MKDQIAKPKVNINIVYKIFMIGKDQFIELKKDRLYRLQYFDGRFHLFFVSPDDELAKPVEIPKEMFFVIAGIERFNKVYYSGDIIKARLKPQNLTGGDDHVVYDYCEKDVIGLVEIRKLGGLGFGVIAANPKDEFDAIIGKFIRIKESDQVIGHILKDKHLIAEFTK